MSLKRLVPLAKETYSRWSDHNAPRLGASVAFYSILSFAPLLVLITGVIGLVFGHESAHGALISEARQIIGDRGADTVQSLLKNADKPASGIFASVIAFITLLFGASGVFTELKDALNIMWDAPKETSSGFMGMIKDRLFSFGMVLSVGFLLLVSLVLSAGLAFVGHAFGQAVPLPAFVLQIISFVVSFAVISALFALMFKYVPNVQIAWRDVIVGAIGTALLFSIGKFLLGIYLGKASVGSTYGAAGSLVAVVVWIYYSAQIFFFGAEFTRVYSNAHRTQTTEQKPAQEPAASASADAESKPKAMAAAAGASHFYEPPITSYKPPVTSYEPPVISHELPVTPSLALPDLANDRPMRPVLATLPKPTKPRLLTAMAVGFVLGRVASSVRNRAPRK